MIKLILKNFSMIIIPFFIFAIITALCIGIYIFEPGNSIIMLLLPCFYISAVPILSFWMENERKSDKFKNIEYTSTQYAFARYITALIFEAIAVGACIYAFSFCESNGHTNYGEDISVILGRILVSCPLLTSALLFPRFFPGRKSSGLTIFMVILVYFLLVGIYIYGIFLILEMYTPRMYIRTPDYSWYVSKSDALAYTNLLLIASAVMYAISFIISSRAVEYEEIAPTPLYIPEEFKK